MEVLGWNIPLWIILVVILAISYYMYMTWTFQTFKRMGVSGPTPRPFVGNLIDDQRHGMGKVDTQRMKKYGKVWGTFDGRLPNLYVADENILRDVFIKQFQDFPDRRVIDGFNGDLEKALTVLKGDQWKNVRHLMSPTFSSGKLKKMVPLITKSADSLVEGMVKAVETDSELDMKRHFGGFTMDVIAATAFGIETNSNKNPDDPFVKNAARFLDFTLASWQFVLAFFFPFLVKIIGPVFGLSFVPKDVQQFFRTVVVREINKRSSEREDYVDFLQLMMQSHINAEDGKEGEKKGMTFKEILGNALIFFFAGYETTASTLSFLSYEMAKNPEIQEKLYREIKDTLGDEQPNYENISNIRYLDMCINETLRKYPPAMRLDRCCAQDTDLHGLKIRKGTLISVPIHAIHHNPELWEDPEKYDPDRFLPENKAKHTQFQFIPFGYGPRNCIGMRLALLEAKIAFVKVIRKFQFSAGENTKIPADVDKKGLMAPDHMWVCVRARN